MSHHATLLVAFDDVVARFPDNDAVRCDERVLSYRELDDAAAALAARLQERGATPGSLVAILLDRSADMVVAALGVLKAGCAYVPLDPAAPPGGVAGVR
jgi:non-ribosomal peptide synthetase component F